jgi:hypothetical protein
MFCLMSIRFSLGGVAAFVLVAGTAHAQKAESYEAAIADGTRIADHNALAELAASYFTECPTNEGDLSLRQCQSVRTWQLEQNRSEVFITVGDDAALAVTPYDSADKKLGLEVHGCIACGHPIKLGDGKPRFFTTRAPKAIKGGRAIGLDLAFHDVPFKSEKEASDWQKKMLPRLRVEFAFKIGPVWKSGPFEGLTFIPVGHRIFDRCNGTVLAADPPSTSKGPLLRDSGCPEELSEAERKAREDANLPDQLSRVDINRALAGARAKVHDCFTEFEQAGTANVVMVVDREGKIESVKIMPPFDKTPTGYCVRTAIENTTFPRYKGEKMIIKYPFQLQ